MDNILEQIQSLTDKFNNLFEVEGLGEPSGDVPPSTNKIKKDKKTKDGKVELVSVEDELFPKEGNAKEQFRQKVIDKINGMIQGTATLEDLLQLVRSKQVKPVKEGFEGAIEILEDLMSYIIETNLINRRDQHHISKKSVADTEEELKNSPLLHAQSLERMRFGYNNGKDDRKDVAQYRIGMHDGAKSPTHAYKPEYRYDSDSTPADRAEETKSRIRRAHNIETDEETDESFECAIEILEQLLAEADHHANKKNPVVKITDKNYGVASGKGLSGPFNKNHVGQYIVYNKDTDASYLVTPDNWKKSKIKKDLEAQGKFYEALEEAVELLEEEEAKKERKNNKQRVFRRMDDPEKNKIGVKKNYNRVIHNDSSSKDPYFNYVKIKGVKYRVNDRGQIGEPIENNSKVFPMKEAIELLEEIIKESSHKRKYGNSNAEDGDTVGHLGTKYFKDGSAMHPHRVTKSNGHNGVDYAPHGTEYYDFDDKKVLQDTIKKLKREGKEGLEGDEFKKVQKELTNPETKNNMYGAPVRWASWKLANRKGKSDLPHKGIGVHTYRKGENDGSKTKDNKDVKERVSKTKERLMDKSESFPQAITQIEDLLQCLGESKYVAELPSVAEKVRPQRKAEADEAHAELERATHLNPYSMLNGELSKKQKDMIAKAIDKASRADARLAHANNIINKPKKEEKFSGIKFDKILCNYEEAIEMLEGFFVKDGRGDLIDDMVKVVTKKPIMKHIQDFTKKILKPKNKPEEKK